jgi:hypothetical protein
MLAVDIRTGLQAVHVDLVVEERESGPDTVDTWVEKQVVIHQVAVSGAAVTGDRVAIVVEDVPFDQRKTAFSHGQRTGHRRTVCRERLGRDGERR